MAESRALTPWVVAIALVVASACRSDAAPDTRYRVPRFTRIHVERDVTYDASSQLRLDIYEPDADRETMRPALVWVHGGGFTGGDKSAGPLIDFPRSFAALGYVALSIDYRQLAPSPCVTDAIDSPACTRAADAAIHDAGAAVAWLRSNAGSYRVDPTRIAVAGESAGAMVAVGVGTEPQRDPWVRAWVSVSGGVAPGRTVPPGAAPGLLFSGTDDPLVPVQRSTTTAEAMRAVGADVVLRTLDGAGHVPVQYAPLFETEARDFLYDRLDLADL
ncbi:MAG TPA: alpha/beta hydrolase [Acidimicrobiales bacterium]|nr:alpha/beta hydrolase [Acidimicrobiales bacterium]